MMYKLDDIYAS